MYHVMGAGEWRSKSPRDSDGVVRVEGHQGAVSIQRLAPQLATSEHTSQPTRQLALRPVRCRLPAMASHDRAQRCPLGIRSHLSSTPRCRCTGAKTLHRGVASTISPRSRYVAGSRHSSRPRSVQCWDALPPARHMFAAAAVPGRCMGKMRTAASIIYPHGYLCRSTARMNNPFMPNWNY